jgi:L-fuconolactonase
LLEPLGFTYDLVVLPDQLKSVYELVLSFPNQKFVLDHIGKPDIKNQILSDWAMDIKALALLDNVSCKVSGLVTEANLRTWQKDDFRPFLDVVFECFGPQRTMFGSDWPVCRLAATYGQVVDILDNYMFSFSAFEKELFWGGNAIKFYNL